ncbi:ferredoxin--NADP reductase [Shewanella surugensis]|uniref:ferredoxin--NADP(+) reductase n=1 Tax=Shewanella surugensis TaxID=212020 RepID=A0ABT0LBE0_9GAMM|nr:ferredoxin--NADP reductase [Shewanella surugensis]MCL1124491.1 ferredoxin--NADP reductase [Shewanella surugensis]
MWTTGQVVERIDWNDRLFTLKIKAELAPFIAGQFIKLSQQIDGRRVARAYSLVNAPNSDYLEVLAVVVENGQLSPYLHDLTAGDSIQITAAAAGFMTLNELPQSDDKQSDLWFLATGTAVGPFISIMETQEPWQRFKKVILVYGVREKKDLAYLDKLQALALAYPKQFTLILSVTRETVDGALDERIPDALVNGHIEEKAGAKLTPEHSQVMLCGNPGMISEAVIALKAKGMVKNLRRAPGQITMEKYW